jgi:hypothetical protein
MKTIPLTEKDLGKIKELYAEELDRLRKREGELIDILKKLGGATVSEVVKLDVASSNTEKKVVEKTAVKPVAEKAKRGPKAKVTAPAVETKQPVKKAITKVKPEPKAAKPAKVEKIAKAKKVKAEKPAKAVKPVKPVKPVKAVKAPKAPKAVKPEGEKGKPGRKKSDNSQRSKATAAFIRIIEKQNKMVPSRIVIEEYMKQENIPANQFDKMRSSFSGCFTELKKNKSLITTLPIKGQKGELFGLTKWFNEKGQLIDPSKG